MKLWLNNLILSFLTWRISRGKFFLFKKWIILEGKKEKIIEAVKNKSNFPNRLFEYLSLALGVDAKWYRQAEWTNVIRAFYACLAKSPQIKLPLTSPTNEKFEDEPWNYENRHWNLYSHIISSAYGWSLEYISQLQVEMALGMIQEIMTDKQLEREFQYGLSEIAYPYNEQTKKSIFKPLERPHWMRVKILPIPRFKIPARMLPAGIVDMKAIPDEYLPKEITH